MATTTTLAVLIPPEPSRFAPMVDQLKAEGVRVSMALPLPDNPSYGSGAEIVIRTESEAIRYTPEDIMAAAWVYRAALRAKTDLVDIDSVGVAFERPSGQIEMSSVQPVDRTLPADWYEPAVMTLEDAVPRLRQATEAALASGRWHLDDLRAMVDVDGTRIVWAIFTVDTLAVFNAGRIGLNAVATAIYNLNTNSVAKIGALRTDVHLPSGEPVVSVLTDLQLQMGTAWEAEGVQAEGPRPATTSAPVTTEAP